MRLKREFFNRNTVLVAQELLGKFLVRKIGDKIIRARIIETEAYCGTKDLACHASKGLTERTKVMFGPAGFSYVYMIYGMYHCLNVVTEKRGNPSAVLIRAVVIQNAKIKTQNDSSFDKPVDNRLRKSVIHRFEFKNKLNGPGILCRELRIDRKLNAVDLTKSKLLWIEDPAPSFSADRHKGADLVRGKRSWSKLLCLKIKVGKRIGVDYAGKWKDKPWRFYF